MGFSDDSNGKESACNAGDLGSVPGSGRTPGRVCGNPLQYSCLQNPHRQWSLVGYSACSSKEFDLTEQLSTHTQTKSLNIWHHQYGNLSTGASHINTCNKSCSQILC